MRISPNGLRFLMQAEDTILHIYKDAAGYPTIGTGHLIRKGEDYSRGLTTEQAQDLLQSDLVRFEDAVNRLVKVPLTQSQYDALVSFAFNVGVAAFKASTLLKKLNTGDYESIPGQLMRWTKAGGKELSGLVARRQNEVKLWEVA
jgi:lysozyme